MQQFYFKFEYRRGAAHTNADCLSRVPVTHLKLLQLFDGDTLLETQLADPQLQPIIAALLQNKELPTTVVGLRHCFLQDGVLCQRYVCSTTHISHIQVVVPAILRDSVLNHLHNSSGHFGVKRTTALVKDGFYWPGYEADITQWIHSCNLCKHRQPSTRTSHAPLGVIEATTPFEYLSWDIMGPLPVSERGNRYILVVTDLFTKWVEAFPISNTLSTTLATVLVDEVICRYGVPSYLHSDQGANLCSEVVSCLCKLCDIHKTHTSAYHPQGNGQVERFNRTVESILSKMVQANQQNWDVQLPKALFVYRCSIHESTGFTPYHLNFGRSPPPTD